MIKYKYVWLRENEKDFKQILHQGNDTPSVVPFFIAEKMVENIGIVQYNVLYWGWLGL